MSHLSSPSEWTNSGSFKFGSSATGSTEGAHAIIQAELARKEWIDAPVLAHYLKINEVNSTFVTRCRSHLENHVGVQTELQTLRGQLTESEDVKAEEVTRTGVNKALRMYLSLVRER